jgi:hypothetical protein
MRSYQNSTARKDLDETKNRRKRRVTFSSEVTTRVAPAVIETDENSDNRHTESWYNLSELETIKRSIKEQAQKYHILSSKAVSSTATMSSLVLPFRNCGVYKKMKYLVKVQSMLNDDDDDSSKSCHSSSKFTPEFRGLENRIFAERQRNKAIATKTIMEYQRRAEMLVDQAIQEQRPETEITLMKEQFADRLSTICSQLSQWAKDEALAIARFDAEGVYGIPNGQHQGPLKAMTPIVREAGGCAKHVMSSSSKRKLSSTSANNQAVWVEQQSQMTKRRRVAMENICLSI